MNSNNRTSFFRPLSVVLAAGLVGLAGFASVTSAWGFESPDASKSKSSHATPKKSSSGSHASPKKSSRNSHAVPKDSRGTTSRSSHAVDEGKSRGKPGKATKNHQDDSQEHDLGIEQSPVDIPAGMPTHNPDIEFFYEPMSLNIINNGHTVQVNSDGDSFIEVEGRKYSLLQFHFHALSEHTVAGEHSDMEVHFVHQSADGEYAVVGIFLEQGDKNAAYGPVFGNIPTEPGGVVQVSGVAINTIDLMPKDRAYYRYEGSFTTPPYTEGVKWFVMSNPIELSATQVHTFTSLYKDNYRTVQSINERTFIAGSSSCECCQARKVLASFGDESMISE